MSVIVKRLKSNAMEVYVKGAPEVMGDICEKDSCMTLGCSQFIISYLAPNSPTGLR
jgi:magnesium-transporting ATPase (P-type)